MAEVLRYFSYDQTLFDRLSDVVISQKSIPALAEVLATSHYYPSRSDYIRLERELTAWQPAHSMILEVAGLKLFPRQWAQRAAEKLYSLSIEQLRQNLVLISTVSMEAQLKQGPWLFLASCSPLYRERIFGDWHFLPTQIMPYDGPTVVADAVGGIYPAGELYSIAIDAEDVKQLAVELVQLDVAKLITGDTRELASMFESANGGLNDFKDTFVDEFDEIIAVFQQAANQQYGLNIVFE